MKTEIALSSCEAEYCTQDCRTVLYALREAIPIIELLKELKQRGFPVTKATASVHRKVFEDNSGALEIARTHK